MSEARHYTRPIVVTLDPSAHQERLLAQYCGARWFAYNWVLGGVRENLEVRRREREAGVAEGALTPAVSWSAYSRGGPERGAQLVANWVRVLGPVVASERAETTWPETVVADSTWFDVRNTPDGTKSRAFNVAGVYGSQDEGPPRTWALHASPPPRQSDWVRLGVVCRVSPGSWSATTTRRSSVRSPRCGRPPR